MRALAEDRRRDGRRLALVPTMGFLHEGHLSLLREARASADVLILSIFVNPTQFAPGEDLDRYPRDEQGDLGKADSCGVDFVFLPVPASMYPDGYQTTITVNELAGPLCGASRPGHFAGVATVVAKLFNLTVPHLAIFGAKDFQQLAVIRRMVIDLDFPIEVRGMPIVREPDGLAMSSRNRSLSVAERARALSLTSSLDIAQALVEAGETNPSTIVATIVRHIEGSTAPGDLVDYIELLDAATLLPIGKVDHPTVLAMAMHIGKTRLIDNCVLRPG